MIKKYIRDEKGGKIGLMLADKVGEEHYGIGYSVARPDSPDEFDEELGLTIASNRMKNMVVNSKIFYGNALAHTSFNEELIVFIDRAKRYFKDREPLADTEEKVV